MPGRIAVVDDEESVRTLLATILEDRGYEVQAFSTIASARESLRESMPDLLIVDVRLPDGCGLDLVGALRDESGHKVPAIVLSGMCEERDIVRGFAAGAVDYLPKPFVRGELLARCAVHLARSTPFDAPRDVAQDLPEHDGLAFGRYLVLSELGRGGYGTVYLALDEQRRHEKVALKVLAPLAGEHPDVRMRFIRETYALSSVRDPHVVPVYDVGCAQGRLYYAMEHVPGGSLHARVLQARLDEAEARSVARGLLQALASLEAAGILHRDIKPENVILRDRKIDQPVLIDFGLAKRRFDHGVTEADLLVGTISYLPPEVIRGRDPDLRSDLFSLGMTLRNALQGDEVFPQLKGVELMNAIARGPIPMPDAALSDGFRAFLSCLCAVEPDERYRSASEAGAALDALDTRPAPGIEGVGALGGGGTERDFPRGR